MVDYFGKYRAQVLDIQDPELLGRIQVSVPSITEYNDTKWAMPCTPLAGPGMGFFALPQIGDNVWVEFEEGNLNLPIWVGSFWATPSDLPAELQGGEPEKVQVFKVPGFSFTIEANGGVALTAETPVVDKQLQMIFNDNGMILRTAEENVMIVSADSIQLRPHKD